jgi:hypothetical protein
MKDRMLWRFAVSGLTAGLILLAGGSLVVSELAPLARGYGLLVLLASLYLAAGLAIRARIGRSPATAGVRRSGAASPSSSRPI